MVLQSGAATNITQPDNPNTINTSHRSKDLKRALVVHTNPE